jgi:spore coat polysaccharide biosynthesis protein SpsF
LTTSNREDDKILTDIAKKNKISYFCGDLDNVSKRVHDCVKHFNFTSFFRVNGDSPIIDKALLRKALTLIHDFDFVTNLSPRSYPYGVSVELIKSDTFFKYQKKFNKDQQEHITKFFYENNEFIKTINLISDIGYKPDTVLTIDDMNSYQTFWKLFSEHPNVLDLSVKEIITLINKNK